MAHTPGPWSWLEGRPNSFSVCIDDTYFAVRTEAAEADARLIAAAPDLLAALQTLERAIANNEPFSRAEHEQAKAAIAKAS